MTEPCTIFLLSPAKLSGRRGAMLLNPSTKFRLANELRSAEGAALGDLFSFVSGLYFRGKLAYARAFGRAGAGTETSYVISAGGGLCTVDERVTLQRLRGWANVSIHQHNPHFSVPLVRHASALLERSAALTRFVLLGSIANDKYVEPLLDVFGQALFFPAEFAGLGDMSRGGLLLRAVRDKRELAYVPVATTRR
ncbi:MAG: hypothetical protein WDO69_04425 [Pseudomonadota bacterium]